LSNVVLRHGDELAGLDYECDAADRLYFFGFLLEDFPDLVGPHGCRITVVHILSAHRSNFIASATSMRVARYAG
jgi:hypothetical protein